MKKFFMISLLAYSQLNGANVQEIGEQANHDMAAAMNTTVNAASSVLVCTIIGKGVKASFKTLELVDDSAINYACGTLYAAFLGSRALGITKDSALVNKK